MDPDTQRILREMGVLPQDFTALQQARTPEEATRLLEAIKEKVRVGFKRLAFELHPDRTGNDPEKTRRFKLVCALKSDIDKITVNSTPRPPVAMRHVTVIHYQVQPSVRPRHSGRTQNAWAATTLSPNGVRGSR